MASLLDRLALVWTWRRGFHGGPVASSQTRNWKPLDRPEGFAAVDHRPPSRMFHVPGRSDQEIITNLLAVFVDAR